MDGVKVRLGMAANAAMGTVQRRGLNEFRHLEVDVFRIQEQHVRRFFPLFKVPWPRNPSDTLTKNVPQAATDLYLDLRNLRIIAGRSSFA